MAQKPIATKIPKELIAQKHKRIDNYYWMNQRDSADVLEYIKQENEYCEKYFKPLSPLVDELMEEFDQRIDPNEQGAPFYFNTKLYQVKSEKGLEYQKTLQTYWADNAISITVYYKKEELPKIKEWLSENYNDSVKSVSFMLHSEHGFAQAPLEEIDEETHNEMIKKVSKINKLINDEGDFTLKNSLECDSSGCPIR